MNYKTTRKTIGKPAFSMFLLLFLAPLWMFLASPSASGQTAEEVVRKALIARGGLDKIRAIQAQRVTGTISFGPGIEGPFAVELKRPLKMHMEINLQGQVLIRVYDGKSTGWIINPFAENKDVQPMTGNDLKNISDESDFDGPLVDYHAKGNQIELVGKDQMDGKSVYRLKLTRKNGDVRFYLFDASSFLLLKWEGKRQADEKDKEIPVESFFHDYRDVNGVKFAFEIDSSSPGTDQQQKILIDKIELDPQMDDSRFGKPTPPAAANGDTQSGWRTTAGSGD